MTPALSYQRQYFQEAKSAAVAGFRLCQKL